ncbi:MBL fold metallo-hydrolase [Methanothrix sp.]|uniref:MBL fold metallo-hydrolase n=1 Tax=Methanothrix sp. TaxID=90426 RepID=UPI00257E2E62|nr:MBL fold metallo-hydrolase [Methanothrix sp.]
MYLDLLPRLNIYRSDLIPADLSINHYPALDVAAVLLSHAHLDHGGNIGMLREDIPVVASQESIVIMKGMRDAGISSLESETAYFSPRQPSDDQGLYLSSDRSKIYQGRTFCCTEEPCEALITFLSRRPGQDGRTARKLLPGRCCCYDEAEFPFGISAHLVDHSIPGAVAYMLRGESTVAYTGDFRVHGRRAEASRKFIRQAKEASVLIIEGTRAGPSEGERSSEESVREACLKAVEDSEGVVIADFSPRNFERLETFKDIATKTGRELVAMAKDIYMLHSLQDVGGSCSTDGLRIYKEITSRSNRKWETEVVQAEYGDRYIDHATIRRNPEGYILCFSFFDMKHLLDIKPQGGTYIYSACEAFNEEMEIDFRRLWQWLQRFGIKPCGFSLDERGDVSFDRRYHASGHASGEDIVRAIEEIDPDLIVPVHTENAAWFEETFEKVLRVEEGKRYEL